MTIRQAMTQGILRLKRPSWPDNAYLLLRKLDDGSLNPYGALYTGCAWQHDDEDNPPTQVAGHEDDEGFEPYTGEAAEGEK